MKDFALFLFGAGLVAGIPGNIGGSAKHLIQVSIENWFGFMSDNLSLVSR